MTFEELPTDLQFWADNAIESVGFRSLCVNVFGKPPPIGTTKEQFIVWIEAREPVRKPHSGQIEPRERRERRDTIELVIDDVRRRFPATIDLNTSMSETEYGHCTYRVGRSFSDTVSYPLDHLFDDGDEMDESEFMEKLSEHLRENYYCDDHDGGYEYDNHESTDSDNYDEDISFDIDDYEEIEDEDDEEEEDEDD
jgi:hypothetical protein